MIVAIDGPAASGKSTTAKMVAEETGFSYLDTGAMYRTVTYAIQKSGVTLRNSEELKTFLDSLDIQQSWENGTCRVFLNGKDVSNAIRSLEVTNYVSEVSAVPLVRETMVRIQRRLGRTGNYVVEGRDIGTVVFPDADWKFFLVADDKTRAIRRQKDLKSLGIDQDLDSLLIDIRERDRKDSSRTHSPLKKAENAVEVDTSNLTIQEQVQLIVNHIKPTLVKETT
ncbi:MAG: (d)CMP kinase [Fidelibacterota bacterium]